jgi:hypothetical protein
VETLPIRTSEGYSPPGFDEHGVGRAPGGDPADKGGREMKGWMRVAALGVAACTLVAAVSSARAEDDDESNTKVELSGFAMLDMGYDVNQNHPDWFDVIRPTKLPSFENEFGEDGRTYAGVRQSRLGVKSWTTTSVGDLYTIFEFELFGTGVDAGQTTFRLRHAYGELGAFGAGQTWSAFMDIDVFPNSIEYWGPNGMVFFRNVQVRWMPMKGANALTIALERPGASADAGALADRIEIANIQGRFPAPDLSGHFRMNRDWGHVQLSGIVRLIEWDDTLDDAFDLSGNEVGWGAHVSTNVKIARDTIRASVVYGEGIQNYMNDAPVDVGLASNPGNILTPVIGEALPMLGIVLFYDKTWSDQWTSTIGYSRLDIDNSDLQTGDAFKVGQYGLVNILYTPIPSVMLGPELQWGQRENNSDGFSVDDVRIQFSAKYKFGKTWGGQ